MPRRLRAEGLAGVGAVDRLLELALRVELLKLRERGADGDGHRAERGGDRLDRLEDAADPGVLIADPAIQEQVAAVMVDSLYSSVDVTAELEARLPEDLQALAGPIAGLSRQLADRAAVEILERPRLQEVYVTAVGVAHERLVRLLEGDTRLIETEGGVVAIDIRPLVVELGTRFSISEEVVAKIPEDKARIVIMESDDLDLAQDATQLLKVVANWIWLLALASWVAAVWLARGRRRLELRAIAIGLVVAGLATVVVRSAAGSYLVDELVVSDSVRPAAENAWSIITESLSQSGWTVAIIGLLALLGLWFAGPGRRATSARGALAPFLRRADVSYGALFVLFLLFVWWTPIVNARTVLVVAVLSAVGLEIVRRQAVREFPEAEAPEDLWAAIRGIRRG
jgi:hypothetical protein